MMNKPYDFEILKMKFHKIAVAHLATYGIDASNTFTTSQLSIDPDDIAVYKAVYKVVYKLWFQLDTNLNQISVTVIYDLQNDVVYSVYCEFIDLGFKPEGTENWQ